MAGSEAEERIRGKGEAMLRRVYPDARIIHELQLEQGGVRIDMAAICPSRIIAVEIKSERDTLKRLRRQLSRAVEVADEVWACVAAKHYQGALAFWTYPKRDDHAEDEGYDAAIQAYAKRRSGARLYAEIGTDGEMILDLHTKGYSDHCIDPRLRFDLLWASEMRSALGRHFGGAQISASSKMSRAHMTRQAVEYMTGQELRRAVCAQLRARDFPRADPPATAMEEGQYGLKV